MKRRIVCILTALAIMIPTVGYGTPSITAQIQGNLLTITGAGLGLGAWVNILIEAPDKSLFEIVTKTVQGGAFTASYHMDDAQEGTYHVVAMPDGGEKVSIMVEYTVTSGTTDHIAVTDGQMVSVYAVVEHMASLSDKVFSFTYDSEKLSVIDLAGQTFARESEPGTYGIVKIISAIPGKIVFSVNEDIPAGETLSGVINQFVFTAMETGEAQISLSLTEE